MPKKPVKKKEEYEVEYIKVIRLIFLPMIMLCLFQLVRGL